jgi:hypothetical protein
LVSAKFAPVDTPDAVAVTEYVPALVLAVKLPAVAVPVASVTAVVVVNPPENVPPGPSGAVNVTVTFGTGFPSASLTSACNGFPKVVSTIVVCGVPPVGAIDPGAPGVFVRVKLAVPETPVTAAVTVKPPATIFAVNADETATPDALVVPVKVTAPPANVPLAPVGGAVNNTDTFGTGLLKLSTTVACSGLVNCVTIWALCDVPPVADTANAAPAVFVRLKLALNDAVVAVIAYPPAFVLAVKTEVAKTPDEFVIPVNVTAPPTNVPLAPLLGAVKVTDAFGTGFPSPSRTVACNTAANAVFTVALCEFPPVGLMDPAAPAVFVRKKSATVGTPETDAVTV